MDIILMIEQAIIIIEIIKDAEPPQEMRHLPGQSQEWPSQPTYGVVPKEVGAPGSWDLPLLQVQVQPRSGPPKASPQ